jgi:hypothetical protein
MQHTGSYSPLQGVRGVCVFTNEEYQTKHNGYQTKVALVTGITGQDGSYLANYY